MSLNYSLTNIANWEKTCFAGDNMKATTDALIWLTMFVGMDHITAKNAVEFFVRVEMFERLFGAMRVKRFRGKPKQVFMTLEEVKQHIGLETNAGRLSDAQFGKKLIERAKQEIKAKENQ